MSIWKKYKKRKQLASKAGGKVASEPSGAKARADTGYLYYALLAVWYLAIWPLLSYELIVSLLEALTGCDPGNCSRITTPLDDFPPASLVFVSCVILLLFLVTAFEKFESRRLLHILAQTHFYACLLTPSLIGIAGYGVPVPFLISLPYTVFHPAALPVLLGLFGVTWILFFVVFTTDRLFPRLWDRTR